MKKNHCAKIRLLKNLVFGPSKDEQEVVDRRQCTPRLTIRAMLCIKKKMLKIQCNYRTLMWCQLTANVFSEFLLLQFRDMLLIFLLYGFSKHVHISVLSLCVFVRLYCFFRVFFTQYVGFAFNFMHFSVTGHSAKQVEKRGKK